MPVCNNSINISNMEVFILVFKTMTTKKEEKEAAEEVIIPLFNSNFSSNSNSKVASLNS